MITLDEYKKLMFVNKGEWKPSDKTKWKEITVGSDKLYTCDIDNYELKSTKELVKNMQKCNEFEEKTDENYRKYYVENYDTKPIYKVLKYTDGKNEFVSYTKYSIGIQFKTNIKNELKKTDNQKFDPEKVECKLLGCYRSEKFGEIPTKTMNELKKMHGGTGDKKSSKESTKPETKISIKVTIDDFEKELEKYYDVAKRTMYRIYEFTNDKKEKFYYGSYKKIKANDARKECNLSKDYKMDLKIEQDVFCDYQAQLLVDKFIFDNECANKGQYTFFNPNFDKEQMERFVFCMVQIKKIEDIDFKLDLKKWNVVYIDFDDAVYFMKIYADDLDNSLIKLYQEIILYSDNILKDKLKEVEKLKLVLVKSDIDKKDIDICYNYCMIKWHLKPILNTIQQKSQNIDANKIKKNVMGALIGITRKV